MENNEYTEKEYQEDKKIATYIFYKHFKTFDRYSKDMINSAIVTLKNAREKYNGKFTYLTYANKVAKNSMLADIQKISKFEQNELAVINDTLKDSEDITLEDTIISDVTPEDELNFKILKQTCNDIINKSKSKLFKQVATLTLEENTPSEIGKILNISRQCADQYVKMFRNELKKILEQERN